MRTRKSSRSTYAHPEVKPLTDQSDRHASRINTHALTEVSPTRFSDQYACAPGSHADTPLGSVCMRTRKSSRSTHAHPEVKPLTDQNDRRADTFLISGHDGTSLKIRDHNEMRPPRPKEDENLPKNEDRPKTTCCIT